MATDGSSTALDAQWLRLIAAGERLATARSLDAIVGVLRDTARDIADAQGITVVLRDGDSAFYAAEDAVDPLWAGHRFPMAECVSGQVMLTRRTVVIPDTLSDARVPQALYRDTFVRSLVMVPIGLPDPVAAIGAYWSAPGDPPPRTVARLQMLARAAAIAIENARLLRSAQDSDRQHALAVEAGRMGVWTLDLATEKLDTSAAFRRAFGRDPARDFSYADLRAAVHPQDRDRVFAAIEHSIATATHYDIQYRLLTPAGEQRWIAIRAAPGYDVAGQPATLQGVSIDITDRMAMEEQLRDLAATLEARVVERTSELEEAQEALRQAQKLEAMGQLTGGVAHDFNNLLTPILGSLDLLQRRGVGSEREQRMIAGALESADRAKTLVQRLLAFARRQPLTPVPVDIAGLLVDMGTLIETTLGPQVALVLEIEPGLPIAMADRNQLEMALLNLAVNARDAMPEGGRLLVAARRRTVVAAAPASDLNAGDYVVVAVTDTGQGMDMETRARAIEPFYSTKGVGRGTGLGLSMVHGLVRQLNGALEIVSAPGAGTTVEMWIPASVQAVIARLIDPAGPPPARGGTVLVVDDEPLVREATREMLADLGYLVLEADSAAAGLALLERRPDVDLVVTDHLMPAMTGAELAQAIHARRPALPVLVISGYADAVDLPADLPRLEKPFRQGDLAERLLVLLGPLLRQR